MGAAPVGPALAGPGQVWAFRPRPRFVSHGSLPSEDSGLQEAQWSVYCPCLCPGHPWPGDRFGRCLTGRGEGWMVAQGTGLTEADVGRAATAEAGTRGGLVFGSSSLRAMALESWGQVQTGTCHSEPGCSRAFSQRLVQSGAGVAPWITGPACWAARCSGPPSPPGPVAQLPGSPRALLSAFTPWAPGLVLVLSELGRVSPAPLDGARPGQQRRSSYSQPRSQPCTQGVSSWDSGTWPWARKLQLGPGDSGTLSRSQLRLA